MSNKHLATFINQLLINMIRIRMVEEAIASRYSEQQMRCPTHLSIGQEAVPAAISLLAETTDYAVSTHRGHAHYLGKGGNLQAMLAEIHGKETGCCKGRGGSMHLVDSSVGFEGTTAIVGNSIPLGVGLALSSAIKCEDKVTFIFLGDGATEEGAFYEAINFSVVKALPVIFICENNFYSVYSPLNVRQPENRKIHEMVAAMGMESTSGDGNNPLEVCDLLEKAITNARKGRKPQFLEFYTYRWLEHCGPNYDDFLGYRDDAEVALWKEKDPVAVLCANPMVDAEYIESQKQLIIDEINLAFSLAINAPYASQEDMYSEVYAH